MEASGSSCITALQESMLSEPSDEDPDPGLSRGQLAIALMNLPLLALV